MRDVGPRVRQCGITSRNRALPKFPNGSFASRDTRPDGDLINLRTKSTHRTPVLVEVEASDPVSLGMNRMLRGGDSTRDLN